MLESHTNPSGSDETLSAEELLGPPKVDIAGFGLMLIMSLVVGLLAGVGVLLFAFLTSGQFSLQSGVSPILLAMITFFCLTFANYLYVWGLSIIFSHIYSKVRTIFIQVSVFSVVLYVAMAGLYLVVNTAYISSAAVLGAFAFHVVFNVFGLILLTGILSQYRYSLLVFYADFISLIITGLIIFWVYTGFTSSGNALFILMGLATVSYFVATLISFGVMSGYYHMYKTSGFDPLGNIFAAIENEEKTMERTAENILLTQK